MLELVLVASQASIARAITVVGAYLQYAKSAFEHGEPETADTSGKTGSARQRVVDVDLSLSSVAPFQRQRRPIFRL